jgi:hypothetical protein
MTNTQFYRLVGVGVALSALGALLYDARIGWLTVFLGVHIVQHTFTGFCLLQKVLNKGDTQ